MILELLWLSHLAVWAFTLMISKKRVKMPKITVPFLYQVRNIFFACSLSYQSKLQSRGALNYSQLHDGLAAVFCNPEVPFQSDRSHVVHLHKRVRRPKIMVPLLYQSRNIYIAGLVSYHSKFQNFATLFPSSNRLRLRWDQIMDRYF